MISRRGFVGVGAAFFAAAGSASAAGKEEVIKGFDEIDPGKLRETPWTPFSDRKVRVDLKTSLDATVSGIYAHMSPMKGGETLKIPASM